MKFVGIIGSLPYPAATMELLLRRDFIGKNVEQRDVEAASDSAVLPLIHTFSSGLLSAYDVVQH
jgi:hypothetical protein